MDICSDPSEASCNAPQKSSIDQLLQGEQRQASASFHPPPVIPPPFPRMRSTDGAVETEEDDVTESAIFVFITPTHISMCRI